MIKVEILGVEKIGTADLRFPLIVYRSTDGTVWTQVVQAPASVSFPATTILAITNNDALTSQEKLAALVSLMKAQVEEFGVSEAEEAIDDLAALGITYPVTINL